MSADGTAAYFRSVSDAVDGKYPLTTRTRTLPDNVSRPPECSHFRNSVLVPCAPSCLVQFRPDRRDMHALNDRPAPVAFGIAQIDALARLRDAPLPAMPEADHYGPVVWVHRVEIRVKDQIVSEGAHSSILRIGLSKTDRSSAHSSSSGSRSRCRSACGKRPDGRTSKPRLRIAPTVDKRTCLFLINVAWSQISRASRSFAAPTESAHSPRCTPL